MTKSARTLNSKRGRISLRTVEALHPGEQIWDLEVRGFVVRHFAKAKTYAVKVRISGRQRYVTIGEHGVFTPDQARAEAKRIKGSIASGDDPTVKREALKHALTVQEVAVRFLAEHCGLADTEDLRSPFVTTPGAPVKPGTARGYRDNLRDHVLPALGKRAIESVTAEDVAALHLRMRKTPYAANRMFSLVSSIRSWARTRKLWRGPSPVDEIARYNEKNRTKFLDADETRRFVQAIADAEDGVPLSCVPLYKLKREAEVAKRRPGSAVLDPGTVARIDPYSAAALRFLLLTGLRPQEALKMGWAHVNFSTGRAHLPSTKTGDRDATLSTHALEFLASVPKLDGNPFVFPGRNPGRPLASLQHAFELVRELAGFGDDVVLYTVRHNFGSTLAAQRVEAYELMRAMGHKNLATSLRYIHLAHEGIQATTSKATAGISDALNAARPKPARDALTEAAARPQRMGSKVVPLRRRRG